MNEESVCEKGINFFFKCGHEKFFLGVRRKKAGTKKSINGTQRLDRKRQEEKWIDGSELKLWEIVDYWKGVESRSRRCTSLSGKCKIANAKSKIIFLTFF